MFGTDLEVRPQEPFTLGFDLASVDGLSRVDLISDGAVVVRRAIAGAPRQAHVDFPLTAQRRTWYALVVEDAKGRKAYSDPIWVDPAVYPPH